jgi:hypothetical protein
MSIGVVIEETMSGWLQLDDEARPRDFSFSIRAFSPRPWRLAAPREFRGRLRLDGVELPVTGTLTLRPGGPAYELDVRHPGLGELHLAGHKTYTLRRLRESMTTCPLTVFRAGEVIGRAEVSYRESPLTFLRKALRLATPATAFGPY